MKHLLSNLILFFVALAYLSCGPAAAEDKEQSQLQTSSTSASSIEGAWKLVWAQHNDTLTDLSDHSQVKMFTQGSFTLLAHDKSGNLKFAGYGKYNFEGDKYHEVFRYHTHKPYIGGEDWQTLSVKGDTMYMNGFTKVVVGGVDKTNGWPKLREKLVRVER